jgi:hypothetical protein
MSRLRPRRLRRRNKDSCGDSASAWRRWRINKPKLTGEKLSITVRLALDRASGIRLQNGKTGEDARGMFLARLSWRAGDTLS